ncbi:hypothetical protein TNCV_4344111 [Trichonephila clavipes]|nr:hypothetical protein TNCV_4344111 [Trichonephila clavipes]
MHNATVHQPLTTVYPNSNPTIVMLQVEVGFVSEHNVAPFCCQCPRSFKRLWFSIKDYRSNEHLADISLCCKQRRMVQADTE